MSGIGFLARLTDQDTVEVPFTATIHPLSEPRWMVPLSNEVLVIARDFGKNLNPYGEELDLLYGRVQLRWGAIEQGFNMPLSARITADGLADVTARCGGDETKARQAIAETAMRDYQPKLREIVLRTLVQEELKATSE